MQWNFSSSRFHRLNVKPLRQLFGGVHLVLVVVNDPHAVAVARLGAGSHVGALDIAGNLNSFILSMFRFLFSYFTVNYQVICRYLFIPKFCTA